VAKAKKRATPSSKGSSASRLAVHLKKEEVQRVDDLRINIAQSKNQNRPDVQSTLELMYLRILGRVKNRGPLEKDLAELKKMLDQVGVKMTEILDKSERQTS
jgi:hypothetical protein